MAVYERPNGARFAIHIENKLAKSDWSQKNQAKAYKARAEFMAGQARFMNYAEFCTVIIAPSSFMQQWREEIRRFDTRIRHEHIADFIPEFKPSS